MTVQCHRSSIQQDQWKNPAQLPHSAKTENLRSENPPMFGRRERERTQNITVYIFNPIHIVSVDGPPTHSSFLLKATDNLKICVILEK